MPHSGGDPAEFWRWKTSVEVVFSGSDGGIWSAIDESLDNLTILMETEVKERLIKGSFTFHSLVYLLRREASGAVYPFQTKRRGRKENVFRVWGALKKSTRETPGNAAWN